MMSRMGNDTREPQPTRRQPTLQDLVEAAVEGSSVIDTTLAMPSSRSRRPKTTSEYSWHSYDNLLTFTQRTVIDQLGEGIA